MGWTDAGDELPGGLRSPHNKMLIGDAVNDAETARNLVRSLSRSIETKLDYQRQGHVERNLDQLVTDFRQVIDLLAEHGVGPSE